MKTLRAFLVAVSAACLTALPVLAGDPTGVWKFQAEMEGRKIDATLTLNWQNDRLSGSIDNRAGKADITDAKFVNDEVSFTVVRKIGKRLRKKTFTVYYTGKLEGDTLQGTIRTKGREDKPISVPWTAARSKT